MAMDENRRSYSGACMVLPFARPAPGQTVRKPGWVPIGKLEGGAGPLRQRLGPKIMRPLVNRSLYKIDHFQGQDSRTPSRSPGAAYARLEYVEQGGGGPDGLPAGYLAHRVITFAQTDRARRNRIPGPHIGVCDG
jgi:hypothetical protein